MIEVADDKIRDSIYVSNFEQADQMFYTKFLLVLFGWRLKIYSLGFDAMRSISKKLFTNQDRFAVLFYSENVSLTTPQGGDPSRKLEAEAEAESLGLYRGLGSIQKTLLSIKSFKCLLKRWYEMPRCH
jgi:hypothetical protein